MWKLQTDLELWWLNLQLGEGQLSVLWGIALVLICLAIMYTYFRIALWQNQLGFAKRLLSTASFIFPPPVVRLRTVVWGVFVIIMVFGIFLVIV
jgi:hypothetical protein